jgi:adenylyltransferase/sulfurtransferase
MVEHILPTELKQRLDRGDAVVVLDVREPDELVLARLPAVVHIPMGDIPNRLHELDPDREVVVMCHHGTRSAHVASFLVQRDFTRVLNLHGGIDAWSLTVDPSVPRY